MELALSKSLWHIKMNSESLLVVPRSPSGTLHKRVSVQIALSVRQQQARKIMKAFMSECFQENNWAVQRESILASQVSVKGYCDVFYSQPFVQPKCVFFLFSMWQSIDIYKVSIIMTVFVKIVQYSNLKDQLDPYPTAYILILTEKQVKIFTALSDHPLTTDPKTNSLKQHLPQQCVR